MKRAVTKIRNVSRLSAISNRATSIRRVNETDNDIGNIEVTMRHDDDDSDDDDNDDDHDDDDVEDDDHDSDDDDNDDDSDRDDEDDDNIFHHNNKYNMMGCLTNDNYTKASSS